MGKMTLSLGLFFFLTISSASAACDRCVRQSKAAFFSSDSVLNNGACGYGPLAVGFGYGQIAGAAASIFKGGAGCGACFQIRCKNPNLCDIKGAVVHVTDLNNNPQYDFVLSNKAFTAMAKEGKGQEVLKLGVTDVEYRRIPCTYTNKRLHVRVEESSNPYYLSIKILYQGGQTEIVAVDVAQVGSNDWSMMSRTNGAIWNTNKVPKGPMQFKFFVGKARKPILAPSVLPADYKNGAIYDSGIQIADVEQEDCSPCSTGGWH